MMLMDTIYLFFSINTILIDMKRSYIFIYLLFLSVLCFAQQNAGIRVIGIIPDATDSRLYQMQVGSFKVVQNASNAFEKLRAASMNPSYEKYLDFTRVMLKGVSAKDVPAYIERIRRAGFSDVFIKIDPANGTAGRQPSISQQPSASRQPSAYDSSEDFYSESQPGNNGAANDFLEPGLWKLTGRDPAGGEWKADIVIKNVRNNNFDGYFDWYKGPDFDYKGKEYFNGKFDSITDKIIFQGTRLENSQNLVLGKYEAYMSTTRDKLYNGWWEEPDDFHMSDWQATKGE